MSDTLSPGSVSCPRCGKASRPAARFCDGCGTLLSSQPAPNAQPTPEEELKYITVLFGDIVDSTVMVAGRSPEEAEIILRPAISAMVESVQAFGGIVNQVLGDGVMALFGAPQSQEDHALRACCAAIRMHESVAASGEPIHLRVGLASGPTLLSTSGVTVAGAYPAFGATIHLASRLQALARPGTTLCAASTRALTGPAADFVPLKPRALRGFGAQQSVFVLAGMRQSASRFSSSVERGLSPLVGRDDELAELSRCAQAASGRSAVAVAIVGEAGAGKSRLAWEFTRLLQTKVWHVIQADAVSYGRDVPYQLVGALLRSAFGISARGDPVESANRIRSRLAELDAAAALAPGLLSLLALPLGEDAAAWDGLDPLHRRDTLRDSVGVLFNTLGRRRPVLLLIEDLQWADEESLRLLDFVPAADCRLFLLTTHRPDFAPTWSRPFSTVITLRPLSPDSMGRLVRQAFPGITDRWLQRALITRSAGNPFFLEELARNVLTADLLREGTHEEQPAIPSTIQVVVAARIDRLAAEVKRILVAASALGNRFSLRTLRGMFDDRSVPDFRSQLQTLSDAGMFESVEQSDSEIGFSHALIQEVAYTGLPRSQRRELHAKIVETIRRIDAERLAEHAEMIVYHAARGEVWDELVNAARIAGRRAASRSAYIEASRIFAQGIDACRHLRHREERLASEIDLRFELRNTLFPTAGIERSLANSTEAERLALQLGDRRRLGWATAYVARDLQLVGRPGAALVAAARALEFADDDQNLIDAARYFGAQASYSRGDYVGAVTTLRALIANLEAGDRTAWRGTPGPSIIFFRAWLIWALSQGGAIAEAETVAGEIRRLADEADLPLCRTIAHLSEGFAFAFAGRLQEAEATLRVSLALCRKWEFFAWSTNISSCLGHVLSRLGQFEEAFDLIQQAIERTSGSGIFVNHAKELAWLAEAHRLAGRPDDAVRVAERAVEVARLYEERGNEVMATVVLAEAMADLGSTVAARSHYATALRLATECEMALFIEQCRANLAAFDGAEPPRSTGSRPIAGSL